MVIHVVAPGETISSIAQQYQVSENILIRDNQLSNPDNLAVGQTLVVLFPSQVYTVQPGDTIYTVARANNITVNQIYRNNPTLGGLPILYPGQTLVLGFTQERRGVLEVNGYAYPFINRTLMRKVLPYLTYVTFFTYGFTPEGNLVDLNDQELIEMARGYGVAPLMHLSTLTEGGGFSNELAHLALTDMTVQNNLINQILENLRKKNYYGLDIDFEYVLATDKDAYTNFIRNLTNRLNPEGYEVIVALAPKTSPEQPGLLYEAHDYRDLGKASNSVLIMTYEWGYTYGPPMAVAPIPKVKEVVDYALEEISSTKIFMGVPTYGYNWTLPYVAGTTKAKSLSSVAATELAANVRASIEYDPVAQSPHFSYRDMDGKVHEVWFEDARSIQAKLDLASLSNLRGIGYWNLMREFPQNWLVLNALYVVRRLL
jgi:spore germination protein